MRTIHSKIFILILLFLGTMETGNTLFGQLVTNWVAYNDYVPGPAPNPTVNNNWGTAPNVNIYNLRGIAGTPPQPTSGYLVDYYSGNPTPAYIIATATGTPDYFGSIQYPTAGTPAFNLFNGLWQSKQRHRHSSAECDPAEYHHHDLYEPGSQQTLCLPWDGSAWK
jgi:hypothetical protein